MTLTRRGFALGTAGAAAASVLARPAIAQSEPIRIGWLGSLTGPLAAPGVGFDRGMRWALDQVNGAGGVKGRKLEIIVRDTQGDPDQGGERHAGTHQPPEGPCDVGAGQFRRGAGDHADHGAPEDARPASLRGQFADRPREIPQRLPSRALQHAMGRRGAPLHARHPQGEGRRGGRRFHRLRHQRGEGRGGELQEGRRQNRLSGDHRPQHLRRDARHAADARRRRQGGCDLERHDRAQLPPDERARRDQVGCAVRRPPGAGYWRGGQAGRQAGELGQRLHGRLPQLQLRRRRQAAAAPAGVRRQDQGKNRAVGYRRCGGCSARRTR